MDEIDDFCKNLKQQCLVLKKAQADEIIIALRNLKISSEDAFNNFINSPLNDAKTYLTGAYPLRFSESGRIAHMLLGIQLAGLDVDYVRNRNGLIEAITRKDIAQVAKKLLDANRLVTVIVGRPKGMLRSQWTNIGTY